MQTITDIDFAVLDFIHENFSCSFLDFIMPKITALGNSGLIWIVSAALMLIFRKSRKTGVEIFAGLLTVAVTGNILLKNIVRRNRPCWINDSIQMLVSVPQDYSFPSGHTMASFASAVIIMHFNKPAGIAAYILAFMIAFSRLYLYVHFPTDILAGILFGTAIGYTIKHIRRNVKNIDVSMNNML